MPKLWRRYIQLFPSAINSPGGLFKLIKILNIGACLTFVNYRKVPNALHYAGMKKVWRHHFKSGALSKNILLVSNQHKEKFPLKTIFSRWLWQWCICEESLLLSLLLRLLLLLCCLFPLLIDHFFDLPEINHLLLTNVPKKSMLLHKVNQREASINSCCCWCCFFFQSELIPQNSWSISAKQVSLSLRFRTFSAVPSLAHEITLEILRR